MTRIVRLVWVQLRTPQLERGVSELTADEHIQELKKEVQGTCLPAAFDFFRNLKLLPVLSDPGRQTNS